MMDSGRVTSNLQPHVIGISQSKVAVQSFGPILTRNWLVTKHDPISPKVTDFPEEKELSMLVDRKTINSLY